jgi:hypothetical protein
VTIPATGKTVFLHSLKQSVAGDKSEIFVLTSDEIRKRVVDYHLAGNKNCSREDAVKKTQKKYTEMYNKELEYLRD